MLLSELLTKDPDTWVISSEAKSRRSSRGNHDRVAAHRVDRSLVDRNPLASVVVLLHNLELVTVQLKREMVPEGRRELGL